MTVKIEEPGKILTNMILTDLERELQASLPAGYRHFLIKNNGGLPWPNAIDIQGLPSSPTDVQVFFGIGRPVESSDLSWNKRTFSERLGERMLPIACDSGGNIFCISLSGEDAGNVFYVDLEQAQTTYYPVAVSFDAFLEKIRD